MQAITPLPTDDSTEGAILCTLFTLTRSRGQAADYELSCQTDPEHMPAGDSLAAPLSKDLGHQCLNGAVGCSPQPLFWAKSFTVCHPELYPVASQAG